METATLTDVTEAFLARDETPDEASMRTEINQMLAEMDRIRDRMRLQDAAIERKQAYIDAILERIKKVA